MNKIKVVCISHTENPTELIANVTRKTYKQNPAWCKDPVLNEAIVSAVLKSGHSTSEHANFTVVITGASRTFLSQIRTHRIASFTSSSQQYITYDNVSYVTPLNYYFLEDRSILEEYREGVKAQVAKYIKHCSVPGLTNDDARYQLPNSARVDLVITANMREWFHIIEQRSCNRNTPETQYTALLIKAALSEVEPTFKKAGVACKFSKGCVEPVKMACKKPTMELDNYEFLIEQINQMPSSITNEY